MKFDTVIKNRIPNSGFLLLILIIIVFLSRLPFIDAGFGRDPDAWRVANTAYSIASTGVYSASRLPGYPIQEIFCSLLWKGGPAILNGITALFSVLAVTFFTLILRAYRCKDYIIAGMSLAFIPIIYINSTNLMDYIWALSFILGAYYFALKKRTYIPGILLGLSIGCRITSVIMIIPLSLIIINYGATRSRLRHLSEFTLATILVGTISFLPVINSYGLDFIKHYGATYPSFSRFFGMLGEELWGRVGLFGVVIAVISQLIGRKIFNAKPSIPQIVDKSHFLSWIAAVFLYLMAFIMLPAASGYLIPAIPFIIILLGRFLDRRLFIFVIITLVLSPFLSFGRSGIYGGPIFIDRSFRQEGMEFTDKVISLTNSLDEKSVIVAGWWLANIKANMLSNSQDLIEYVYLLDEQHLTRYLSQGYNIYYLPDMRKINLEVNNIDLKSYGAKELFPE